MKRLALVLPLAFLLVTPAVFAESLGVYMTGEAEIPPGDPDGVGFADLILEGTTLRYSVVVFNIEAPTAMHIHPGVRGETGPFDIPMNEPFVRHEGCPSVGEAPCTERFVSVGQVEITAGQAEDLRTRPSEFYLNVHNAPHPAGSVRGQVQFARYLPVVGRTPGAALTNWFTRLAALNRSLTGTSNWTIEFIPQSPGGNTARFVSEQMPLAPLHQHFGTDFPVADFTGIGSMRVLSDQPFALTAAIYNRADETSPRGDFGLAIRGLALENARTNGLLIDLTSSSDEDLNALRGHRSNVGFFNPQFFPVEVSFQAFNPEGAIIGERLITVPPGAMAQFPVFDLFDTVQQDQRVHDSFWISWVSSSPIFVYGTVVNNATGDPEFRD